jgi:hypothetical protein
LATAASTTLSMTGVMSHARAVAFDEGDDRLVGHVQREVGIDRDLLAARIPALRLIAASFP